MNSIVCANLVLATAEMEPRLFDLDLQLIADAGLSIIAVFALFLIASHLLFNPVREMLQKRQDKIKGELDDAAKDMADAKELKAEYESRLKDIDKEAENILSEARKKALANENKIVAEAKEEAARQPFCQFCFFLVACSAYAIQFIQHLLTAYCDQLCRPVCRCIPQIH